MPVTKEISYRINLYTTTGCHLCEQVESMLRHFFENNLAISGYCEVEKIEISESEDLIAEFGMRIPVLRVNGNEIGFPFDYHQLSDWIIRAIKKDS